jgi:tetratricopeptide (TPR) repeat protein
MVAGPSDQDPLDAQEEQQRVETALRRLREQGLAELVWLKGQSWRALQRAMRGGPWHIFHFIGHGGFDLQRDEGVLALVNEVGTTELLGATELARLLGDHPSLRLVLINACESARASPQDRFSTLARRGLPAVLAMQYPITNRAANEWTRTFYEAVADGQPVDAAVAEARTAISLALPRSLEWGTPVLYLQARDGILFQLSGQTRPSQVLSPKTAATWLADAQAAHQAGRWQEALSAYEQALQLAPHDPVAAQGRAAVLASLQREAPKPLGPPLTPASPLPQAHAQSSVQPSLPMQNQLSAQAPVRLPEMAQTSPSTPPSPLPLAQSLPPAQTSAPLAGAGASGGKLPLTTPPPDPRAPVPLGRDSFPPRLAPLAGQRPPFRIALAAYLLLVLVGGSLGALSWAGIGPLASQGKQTATATTAPGLPSVVVYVVSVDDSVYALKASDGSKLWSFPTGNRVVSSPVVTNGVVYVGSENGSVYALKASDGSKLWSFPTGSVVVSSPVVVAP